MNQPSLVLLVVFTLSSFSFIGCGAGGSSASAPSTSASNPNPPTGSSQPGGGSGSGSGSGSNPGSGAGSSVTALAFVGSGNQIYGIAVDSSNHVSTTSGSPYTVSGQAVWLATSGHLLFAAGDNPSDPSSANITSFRSDANGSLTKLGNVTAKGIYAVATEASGNFLYASAYVDASNIGSPAPAMYGYAVDQSSGTLTPLPGSPWQINHGASAGELKVTSAYVCVNMALFKANVAIQCYPRHSDGTIDSVNYITPISTNQDQQLRNPIGGFVLQWHRCLPRWKAMGCGYEQGFRKRHHH
ncbi:MAG: hypothetical protein DMG62_22840 [Acidobacteria bacterium]|nr:MAG: hypothetical protein DMG62_22840 [Acidobacteriota bacterium]